MNEPSRQLSTDLQEALLCSFLSSCTVRDMKGYSLFLNMEFHGVLGHALLKCPGSAGSIMAQEEHGV